VQIIFVFLSPVSEGELQLIRNRSEGIKRARNLGAVDFFMKKLKKDAKAKIDVELLLSNPMNRRLLY
jgi:hypothetical protein